MQTECQINSEYWRTNIQSLMTDISTINDILRNDFMRPKYDHILKKKINNYKVRIRRVSEAEEWFEANIPGYVRSDETDKDYLKPSRIRSINFD